VERNIPIATSNVAKESQNFFRQTFNVSGWIDNGVQYWKPRKNKRLRHRLMWKSGALRRSIEIVKLSKNKIKIQSALPYSEIHNSGGEGLAFGKYPFTMPKRQFMGASNLLHSMMVKLIKQKLAI
jgi:phage gpG-like protein